MPPAAPSRAPRAAAPAASSAAPAARSRRAPRARAAPRGAPPPPAPPDAVADYNARMDAKMGWSASGLDPFRYHPARGLYLHALTPSLLVGTQPLHGDDVATLASEHGVTHVVCLQQDKDAREWGVDLGAVAAAAASLGLAHHRAPATDFDPADLRRALPSAVRAIERGVAAGGRVYVHCTAGLGRAPAAAVAYLFWFGGEAHGTHTLDDAHRHVTAVRPCGPKVEAVRGATYDLAAAPGTRPLDHLPRDAFGGLSGEERERVRRRVREGSF